MKTTILQLEMHDDLISAGDRMNWAKGGRILLVWPESGTILNRRLDLVLLQRRAAHLGAQLAIVCRDRSIGYYALRLGIPVFRSLEQAQKSQWRAPRRYRRRSLEELIQSKTDRQGHFHAEEGFPPSDRLGLNRWRRGEYLPALARIFLFIAGVLAYLSIVAILLPGAEISLTPQEIKQEVEITVEASPQIKTTSLAGVIPARWIDVTVEGRAEIPTSDFIWVPDRPAIGFVQFTNLTDQAVDIPLNTVVRTTGNQATRFAVTQAGTLAAGPGESLLLPVRSLIPGSSANLPAGSLSAIEGELGTKLAVTNPQPMSNGKERREPAPSPADRQRLEQQLRAALQRTAYEEIQSSLSQEDILVPNSLELVQQLESSYDPEGQEPADRLTLSQRLEFRALAVDEQHLHSLAEAVLDAGLPSGYIPVKSSLTIQHVEDPTLQPDGKARWQLVAKRTLQANLPPTAVMRLALGKTVGEAEDEIAANLALAGRPVIRLEPAWWPRMPFLPFRIIIINQLAMDTSK